MSATKTTATSTSVVARGGAHIASNGTPTAALHDLWPDWRNVLVIVKPATVIAWHRRAFRGYWRRISRKEGRPTTLDPEEAIDLDQLRSTTPLPDRRELLSEGEILKDQRVA